MARRWWGPLRLVLGLALLAFVISRTGAHQLLPQLRAAPWLLVLFLVQAGLGMALEAFRLHLLVRSQKVALSYGRALRLCITAVPFGYVMPGGVGGDVVKIAGLARDNAGKGLELAAVVLVDRIVGLASLLVVALSAAVASGALGSAPPPLQAAAFLALFALIALVVALVLVWSPSIRAGGLYNWATTRAPLHGMTSRVLEAFYLLKGHRGALATASVATVAGYLVLVGIFILAAPAVMMPAPPLGVMWAGLLAMVANVLPVTPGGLGVGEAAFEAAFGWMGYRGGAQLMLLIRIGVVPFAVLGALLWATRGTHD